MKSSMVVFKEVETKVTICMGKQKNTNIQRNQEKENQS